MGSSVFLGVPPSVPQPDPKAALLWDFPFPVRICTASRRRFEWDAVLQNPSFSPDRRAVVLRETLFHVFTDTPASGFSMLF